MGPRAKECGHLWKLDKTKKWILPRSLQEVQPCPHVGVSLVGVALVSGPPDDEIMHLCCLNPLSVGPFVTATACWSSQQSPSAPERTAHPRSSRLLRIVVFWALCWVKASEVTSSFAGMLGGGLFLSPFHSKRPKVPSNLPKATRSWRPWDFVV